MANDLSAIMHKILAKGVVTLREQCMMIRLVNTDYEAEAKEKGDRIDIPVPVAVGTRDVTPGVTAPTPVDTTPTKVQVVLDQWKQTDPFHLTDKDLVEIDRNEHFMPGQMGEAIKSLANLVNQYLHSLYVNDSQGVYGFHGTPGTTPFNATDGTSSATGVRKVLHRQLCPRSGRRAVLDFDAGANALDLEAFRSAEKVMSKDVVIEGEIGRKYGIDWFEDDHVSTHTAGTIADASAGRTCAVNNASGYAAGIDTINVNNGAEASVTGTIVRGDIISFASHDQTYCVVSNTGSAQFNDTTKEYTFATNAIAGLKFYPALTTAVADNDVITVKATHVVNLAFHRDAFAFGSRPLLGATSEFQLGSLMVAAQDPLTGLALRLEVKRQHKQVSWEFDVLYGGLLVRPQLCARLGG